MILNRRVVLKSMKIKIVLIFLGLIFIPTVIYADTIIMKDRTRMKGLVVDEYVDRVSLSTIDGEKYVFRKDIDRIEYDTPEQNFMQMGMARRVSLTTADLRL